MPCHLVRVPQQESHILSELALGMLRLVILLNRERDARAIKPKSSAAMVGTASRCHLSSPTKPFAASSTKLTISRLFTVGMYGGSLHVTSSVQPCISAAFVITCRTCVMILVI